MILKMITGIVARISRTVAGGGMLWGACWLTMHVYNPLFDRVMTNANSQMDGSFMLVLGVAVCIATLIAVPCLWLLAAIPATFRPARRASKRRADHVANGPRGGYSPRGCCGKCTKHVAPGVCACGIGQACGCPRRGIMPFNAKGNVTWF